VSVPVKSPLGFDGVSLTYTNGAFRAVNDGGNPLDVGHAIGGSDGTIYTARSRLQLIGSVAISDDSTNDATVVNIIGGGGGGGTDISSYVSNCIMKAPANFLTFSGSKITCAAGVSVLIPNGRDPIGGMLLSTPITLGASVTASESIGNNTAGVIFLMGTGELNFALESNYWVSAIEPPSYANCIWYNPSTNIFTSYDALGNLIGPFAGAIIGEFDTNIDGTVGSINGFNVVFISNGIKFHYWEL
jgi:hypothetical protein